MALVWPLHQWQDITLGLSGRTFAAWSCDLWMGTLSCTGTYVLGLRMEHAWWHLSLGLGMDCVPGGSSDLWLKIDHVQLCPGAGSHARWQLYPGARDGDGAWVVPTWGLKCRLGLGNGKKACFRESLWCALTADSWDPRNCTAHCQGIVVVWHELSLHRCRCGVRGLSEYWCHCVPGLCCSLQQDGMGSTPKPCWSGNVHSSSRGSPSRRDQSASPWDSSDI